jgi:hypothetical protein
LTPLAVAATTHLLPSLPLATVPTGVALACASGPLRALGGMGSYKKVETFDKGMPACKNDPTKKYKGDEPSPKGVGHCAHAEKVFYKRS